MRHKEGQELIGRSKSEILDRLGAEFNFFPSDEWSYEVERRWFYFRTILTLHFEDDVCTSVNYRTVLRLF
ncbi:hypothetical protein [Epilithonimonas caeni]|uniref:hypothetical protein n=1 Tax=Epilithonimonas caeni TaxID=365343 RepID=UPI0012EB6095|nr:hypothetical protein [Epilithonimonas caeni]